MKPLSEEEARMRLTSLCAQAEHCTWEMEEKLLKWGIGEDARARILRHLTDERYVDDERYARAFAKDKLRYNKWGGRKISQALYVKRIDREVIRQVLDEIPEEDFLKILRPLLKSKQRSVKGANDYERSRKLAAFAIGRGFSVVQIRKCLDRDIDIEDDEHEDH